MKLRNGHDAELLKEDIIEFWEHLRDLTDECQDKIEIISSRQKFYPGEVPENERIDLYEMVGKLKTCQIMSTLFLDIFTNFAEVVEPPGGGDQ